MDDFLKAVIENDNTESIYDYYQRNMDFIMGGYNTVKKHVTRLLEYRDQLFSDLHKIQDQTSIFVFQDSTEIINQMMLLQTKLRGLKKYDRLKFFEIESNSVDQSDIKLDEARE